MNTTLFYVIAGVVLVFSLLVRTRMQATYKRWSAVPTISGMKGGQVARTILDANGLQRVPVEPVQGTLTDHYDPRKDRLRLSKMNFLGNSVAATAVSAHGHDLRGGRGVVGRLHHLPVPHRRPSPARAAEAAAAQSHVSSDTEQLIDGEIVARIASQES